MSGMSKIIRIELIFMSSYGLSAYRRELKKNFIIVLKL